jgi:hypothetical protein
MATMLARSLGSTILPPLLARSLGPRSVWQFVARVVKTGATPLTQNS